MQIILLPITINQRSQLVQSSKIQEKDNDQGQLTKHAPDKIQGQILVQIITHIQLSFEKIQHF